MSFNFNGINAEVYLIGRGGLTALNSINGSVNAIQNIKYEMIIGQASSVSIGLSPTFDKAKQFIESGILGSCFENINADTISSNFSTINGIAVEIKDDSLISDVPRTNEGTSSSGAGICKLSDESADSKSKKIPPLRKDGFNGMMVRVGYSGNEKRNKSPWFRGMLALPDISFGEEISLTINAQGGIAMVLMNQDVAQCYDTELFNIIEDIAKKIGVQVDWGKNNVALDLANKKVKITQDTNSFLFLSELVDRYGLVIFFSGGDDVISVEHIKIRARADIIGSAPHFELVMYKQINPNPDDNSIPVYPVQSVNSSNNHIFLIGMKKGAESVLVDPDTKEAQIKKADATTRKDKKVLGKTTGGIKQAGHYGDVCLVNKEAEKPAFRNLGQNYRGVDDNTKTIQQNLIDADMNNAWEMTLAAPMIPWAMPGMLVSIDIGGIASLKGIFLIRKVTHVIDSSGGITTFEVCKSMGATMAEDIGLSQNTNSPQVQIGIDTTKKTLINGIAEDVLND